MRTETITVNSLLNGDGIRFIFTSAVQNFNDFGVVAVILVAMIGVGVAEEAGLIAALIRKLVAVAPAGDDHLHHRAARGHLQRRLGRRVPGAHPVRRGRVRRLGRHPLAGIAAAYAGVSAAFFVNVLITPADGIITEVTNEALATVAPNINLNVTPTSSSPIASTLFCAVVMTFVTERCVEPRLGRWDRVRTADDARSTTQTERRRAAQRQRAAALGLIYLLVALAIIGLLTALPGRPCATRRLARSSATHRS